MFDKCVMQFLSLFLPFRFILHYLLQLIPIPSTQYFSIRSTNLKLWRMEERKLSENEVDIHSDAHGNPANQADSTEENDVDVQEPPADLGIGTARKPPDKTLKEKFQTFLHDPKEGSYLGRTPKSWVLIFIFFVCFYAVVAGIWVGCWYIFLHLLHLIGGQLHLLELLDSFLPFFVFSLCHLLSSIQVDAQLLGTLPGRSLVSQFDGNINLKKIKVSLMI